MTPEQQIEARLIVLSGRIAALEVFRSQAETITDTHAALRVAQEIGVDPLAVAACDPRGGKTQPHGARKRLGIELHARGWAVSRIARALWCCEKSVNRWLEPKGEK